MGPWELRIREKLNALAPVLIDLTGESHKHGRPPEAESHFRLVITSEKFAGLSRIDRHRLVMDTVAAELREHVHALGVQAFTPAEFAAREGKTFASPNCGGRR